MINAAQIWQLNSPKLWYILSHGYKLQAMLSFPPRNSVQCHMCEVGQSPIKSTHAKLAVRPRYTWTDRNNFRRCLQRGHANLYLMQQVLQREGQDFKNGQYEIMLIETACDDVVRALQSIIEARHVRIAVKTSVCEQKTTGKNCKQTLLPLTASRLMATLYKLTDNVARWLTPGSK